MSESDDIIRRLEDASENVKRKLIEHLEVVSDEIFAEQMLDTNAEDIKALYEWALADEKYEVCARIKKYEDNN